MKPHHIISAVIGTILLQESAFASGVPVLSLHPNGMLTWTNSYSNALFTVQWAPSLSATPTNVSWEDTWEPLKDFPAPTGLWSNAVPMFYRVFCYPATVRLGDAFFDDASDQSPTNSIFSLQIDHTNIFDGYGGYSGFTYSNTYSPGGIIAGVNTVLVQHAGTSPDVEAANYWLAFDVLGNLRIFKYESGGVVLFLASPTNTPPIYGPLEVQLGQSWTFSGIWLTVIDTNATFQSHTQLSEIQVVNSISDVDYIYFQPGKGEIGSIWYENPSSGWSLR